ncbi:MAG: hypothetical protein AB7V37_04370 [Eubacteriaceae bacterium]
MKIHSDFDDIQKDWLNFVDHDVIGTNLRKPILDSWIRCQKRKMNPRSLNRTPSFSEENFKKILEKNQLLLKNAITFIV